MQRLHRWRVPAFHRQELEIALKSAGLPIEVPSTSSCFQRSKTAGSRIAGRPAIRHDAGAGTRDVERLGKRLAPTESITSVGPPPLCARTSFDQFSLVL